MSNRWPNSYDMTYFLSMHGEKTCDKKYAYFSLDNGYTLNLPHIENIHLEIPMKNENFTEVYENQKINFSDFFSLDVQCAHKQRVLRLKSFNKIELFTRLVVDTY